MKFPVIDTEVHLMHPESLENNFAQDANEPVRTVIHEHKEFSRVKPLMTLESLIKSMKRNGISRCHIMGMSWRHKAWNDANNEYIKECVRKFPNLFFGFYIPHLGDIQQAVNEILTLDKSIFIGVKLLPAWQGRDVNDSALFPLYNAVQERNMFLMVHTDHITQSLNGDTPQKFLSFIKSFPKLKVLAPHMAGMLCLYELLPQYSSLLKNVYYITSVSSTMKFVQFASDIIPNKILYGTDFPFNHCHDQDTQFKELDRLNISEEIKEKILFRNAEKFFNYKKVKK